MPKVEANGFNINYEEQGSGEPLILIPFLSADNACYAFQVADYSKHFTCISLDLCGTGQSDKPDGDVSIELYADDVAAFMEKRGISKAHIFGLSLGAAIGMWLAAKHPDKVKSLSSHSGWAKSDDYLKTVVEGWQASARGLNNVTEMVIVSVFPWCLTPELYVNKFDYVQQLAAFLRSRPAMSVDAFIKQSNAVIAHDVEAELGRITAPTQITFGRRDQLTSLRFADRLRSDIRDAELVTFEDCAHAPIFENTAEFNEKTLEFFKRHSQPMSASV